MKTLDAKFTLEKNRKIGAQPVWILKCPFANTGTLYLSDNVFSVATWESGITTKAWVSSWGAIDENISFGAGTSQVSTFSVNLLIDQNTVTDIGDILWTAANNIETIDCELYLWFNGLPGATNPPELMWTGNIVDFRQINDQEYEVEFSDQSVKKNKIIGNLLSSTTYTSLPSGNVGKVAPIVYGSVTGHKPICIASGGYSELAEDLDTSETGIDLIDASSFGTSGYTINVNGEIMTVTGKSGNTLTVSARSGGVTHSAGDPVVQITTITYLVADHPVKALNHIYVDGVEITTGYTFYTGQSGDEHATYTGKAILVITNAMPAAFDVVETVTETTASGDPSYWTNTANAVDDNDSTHADSVSPNQSLTVNFNAPSTSLFGYIKRQRVDLKWQVNPQYSYATVNYSIGGVTQVAYGGAIYTHDGWSNYVTGGNTAALQIWATGIDHEEGFLYVFEVRQREYTFSPYNSSGSTCEEVLVGGTVTVDVDGYQDDGSGTYTGTASALIEQPDHVFKHFLYTYLGIATANFSTDTATSFAADSYKFGIVINEAQTAKEWLSKMAWQCRCYFRFALGNAYLLYRPDSLSSDKTITASMIAQNNGGRTSIQVERSPLDEVVNKVRAKYNRDWSLSGDGAYAKLYETSDTASITRYGEKENIGLFEWDFINSSAMAADVGAFYLARYKDRKKLVSMNLFLDNCELEFADAVTVTPLSSIVLEIQKANIQPGSGRDMRNDKITVIGKEY